eukprot:TRINITY_DN3311_c0_g1_i2.p1 TRINITY_DN3311_c0_g1~~TRINITY_DN3311_c0_g1_i2.p1  ORF type:complete len:667 (-),score=166.16 TRINITY_DN3311_c0_g1_i2:514-2514(-)
MSKIASGESALLHRLLVHRSRSIEWKPVGIHCMALSFDARFVLIGKSSGDIELWEVGKNEIGLLSTIPGEGVSVQSIAWTPSGRRFFCSYLTGEIREYQRNGSGVHRVEFSHGGAVWCVSVNAKGTHLACGCDDGRVRVYSIEEDDMFLFKTLEPQEGRILSLCWHVDGNVLYYGTSEGYIFKWDLVGGPSTFRITVGSTRREGGFKIWSLLVLEDFTLISGDSQGMTTFWDGIEGTLLQSFPAHRADVLSITCNSIRQATDSSAKGLSKSLCVYSSGIDNAVVQFQYVYDKEMEEEKMKFPGKWIIGHKRRPHTHDVRALLVVPMKPKMEGLLPENVILSGGVDTQLVQIPEKQFSSTFRPRKAFPYPLSRMFSYASVDDLNTWVLAHHIDHLDLWRVQRYGDADGSHGHVEDGMRWKHHTPMLHLLRFNCSKHGGILSSALSDDGKIVLYSTRKGTRLFQLELPEDGVSALDGMIAPSTANISKLLPFLQKMIVLRALFIPGSHRVVLLLNDGRVMHVDINLEDISSIEAHPVITLEAPLTSWSTSCDGQWLAIAEANRQIQIWNMDTWKVHDVLPIFEAPCIDLQFHPSNSSEVTAVCSGNSFFFYNVERKRLSDWSKANQKLPHEFSKLHHHIRCARHHPSDPNVTFFIAHSYICIVDRSKV